MELENNCETSTGVGPEAEVGSMVQVLIQAIQSRDEALLSELLRQSSFEVVEATSRRLPAEFTLPCLEIMVDQLMKYPKRSRKLLKWINCIMRSKSSFLCSIKHNDPSSPIRRLKLFLSSRVQVLEELSKLRSKLGIIVSNNTERYNLSIKSSISPTISLVESCDASNEIEERILNGQDGSNGLETLDNDPIHEKPLNERKRKRTDRDKISISIISPESHKKEKRKRKNGKVNGIHEHSTSIEVNH
ncbi:WD repeat-containing protein 43 [Thelohanellus kitauei]|uniref:WD repeat-containing protein 43 n=1 Tax=Thelohanellus kitauei TaxID=669202 RepID=A0A0C2MBV3_THEKT|nr:WD repeat-containing protein 43 [Thelohanellus kitauei]